MTTWWFYNFWLLHLINIIDLQCPIAFKTTSVYYIGTAVIFGLNEGLPAM